MTKFVVRYSNLTLVPIRSMLQRGCGEIKRGSFVHGPFGPNAASMPAHDAIHRCQADPCSFELLLSMQPLKNAEQFVGIFHIEPDTVVADINGCLAVASISADFNLSLRTRASIFNGI